jgi:hypothetical protein
LLLLQLLRLLLLLLLRLLLLQLLRLLLLLLLRLLLLLLTVEQLRLTGQPVTGSQNLSAFGELSERTSRRKKTHAKRIYCSLLNFWNLTLPPVLSSMLKMDAGFNKLNRITFLKLNPS